MPYSVREDTLNVGKLGIIGKKQSVEEGPPNHANKHPNRSSNCQVWIRNAGSRSQLESKVPALDGDRGPVAFIICHSPIRVNVAEHHKPVCSILPCPKEVSVVRSC